MNQQSQETIFTLFSQNNIKIKADNKASSLMTQQIQQSPANQASPPTDHFQLSLWKPSEE